MAAGHGDLPMHGIDGMPCGNPLSQFMDVSPDRLIAALEMKPPNVLIACMERLRSLLFKAEACQTHMLRGTHVEPRQYQKRGEGGQKHESSQLTTLIELPLPPSATQTLKKGCSTIQRSVLPMRLSDQATALHMRLVQLKTAVSEGRLDVKAFGVKSDQDNNPAHVAALLRVCLALMGKSAFENPIEHWMLLPRQKLVTLYIDEYAATMNEIIRMANQAAVSADDSSEHPPLAKYAQLEAQTYGAPTSRERIGDKIIQKLNVVVVPMVDRQADPLGPGQIMQGVMSNPVGMPADYLVRHIDMLFRNMALTERETAGQVTTGERETWELLRLTLPKDAVPMIEALICSYGGEEERVRLGISARRRHNAIARVAGVKAELDGLAKSADAHVANCKNKNIEAAREHHIRGKAKQIGVWLDPSKRTCPEQRQRYQDKHLHQHQPQQAPAPAALNDADAVIDSGWGEQEPVDTGEQVQLQGQLQIHALTHHLYAQQQQQHMLSPAPPGSPLHDMRSHSTHIPANSSSNIGANQRHLGTQQGCGLRLQDTQGCGLRLEDSRLQELHIISAGQALAGIDYATLLVPQQQIGQADRERRARVPKEERQYWSDKNDFCRCLEVVLDEVEGRMSKRQKKLAAERGEGPKRGRKRKVYPLIQEGEEDLRQQRSRKKPPGIGHPGAHLVSAEMAPVPPPPGICGGSAGTLGLSGAWQMAREIQMHSIHVPVGIVAPEDCDI